METTYTVTDKAGEQLKDHGRKNEFESYKAAEQFRQAYADRVSTREGNDYDIYEVKEDAWTKIA